MSEHVTQLLEAYYDGELNNRRAQQVETHLQTCETCLAEFESLQSLSALLQEYPAACNLTAPETFAAQVGLRLPRKEANQWQKVFQAGWQWAPLGLLTAWIFVQTTFIVSGILNWALRFVPEASRFAGFLPDAEPGTSILGEINNLTNGKTFTAEPYPEFMSELINAGGLIEYTKQRLARRL